MKTDPKLYLKEIEITQHCLNEAKAILERVTSQMEQELTESKDAAPEPKRSLVSCAVPYLIFTPLAVAEILFGRMKRWLRSVTRRKPIQ